MSLIPELSGQTLLSLLEIIWIDLLLSGDNAVVIALACRGLPPQQQRLGMLLGTGAAILLRVLFAVIITQLMNVPGLKAIGGLLLVWVAIKLFKPTEHDADHVKSSSNLWGAIWTIAVADAIMSLDNVLALAGAARGHLGLFIAGILISIPFIILGSAVFIKLLTRWPWLVWAGAGLLGWISLELILTDPWIGQVFGEIPSALSHFWGPAMGVGLVWLLGWVTYGESKDTLSKTS